MQHISTYIHLIEKLKALLLVAFSLFVGAITTQAQNTPPADTTKTDDQIVVDYSEVFEYIAEGKDVFQKLTGNVELRQDSIYMYCDSATIVNEKNMIAQGHVIIQQNDTVSVFSDSLVYQGEDKLADLYGNVVLVNGKQKLFTDSLKYDLTTKIATYTTGAMLTNDTTQLRSKRGYYYVDRSEVFFKDSVTIVSPDFELRSDTLKYNTDTQVATFLGPTLITQNESRIYCESGFYDVRNHVAEFQNNAQYVQENEGRQAKADMIRYDGKKQEVILEGNATFEEENKKASADRIRYDEVNDVTYLEGNASYQDSMQFIVSDTIRYDNKNEVYSTVGRSRIENEGQILQANRVDFDSERGIGIAMGNVVWEDTSAHITIKCNTADYDKENDYIKASGGRNGRPLMITMVDGDSLYISSDTLVSFADTAAVDTARMLLAYRDVRIFKSNLQATCDSLIYSDADSLFHFFGDTREPIIWADTSQFIADTIRIQLANNSINRIFMRQNAFMINSPDELFFNQIKGKDITAYFKDSNVDKMRVEGNAEAVYYALDDNDLYIGVNETICSEMLINFGANQVETITFYAQPKGSVTPMQQANHEAIQLENFRWITKGRPRSLDDLFLEKSIFLK